jgi:hypothetical protein
MPPPTPPTPPPTDEQKFQALSLAIALAQANRLNQDVAGVVAGAVRLLQFLETGA